MSRGLESCWLIHYFDWPCFHSWRDKFKLLTVGWKGKKKLLIQKILVNHMWQACRNCQIKVIRLWRLRSHVSLTNFKPHLICVAMSKSTSSTMPVTEVQVFLICFRFSPSKFYPDVAIYFLKLRGIFFT